MTLPHRFFAVGAVEVTLTLLAVTPLLCPGLLGRSVAGGLSWAGFALCCFLLFWLLALFWVAIGLASVVYALAELLHEAARAVRAVIRRVHAAAHRAVGA